MPIDPETKTRGEYVQGREIELNVFGEIEISKGQLLMNFSSFEVEDIQSQMIDLMSLMETMLLEYFSDDEVKNYKYPESGNGNYSYNFFEYKELVNMTDQLHILRKIAQNSFIIYNRFKKRLKIGLNIESVSGKKKSSIDSFSSQRDLRFSKMSSSDSWMNQRNLD